MRSSSSPRQDESTIVELAGVDDAPDWDQFVARHAAASVYHLYGWRDVITSVFGRKTYYFIARRDGQVCGVLPVVRLRSLAFGDFLISLPYLNYGGAVADDGSVVRQLVAACCELAQKLRVRHVELRHSTPDLDLPARTDKVTMRRPVGTDPEALFSDLGSKLRAQIRRPQREGATLAVGGPELADDFYRVLSRKYRDLGVPVYPKRWFDAILGRFPEMTRVFVVQLHEQPVAASIVVGYKNTVEVPWAASVRSADRFSVNMYLYWRMLEYAAASDHELFDFGRSTVDSGTYRFKKQWGATPEQLHWYYWLRDDVELPRLNLDNPKYRLASSLWQRMPVWLANAIGPHIVRNLP